MANNRPWITPEYLRTYTNYDSVKNLTDEKLKFYIMRSEMYIISIGKKYYNIDFSNAEKYPTPVDEGLKLADAITTEHYALTSTDDSTFKGLKSETFDDYSYTKYDNQTGSINDLGILDILGSLVPSATTTKKPVMMRLRKL